MERPSQVEFSVRADPSEYLSSGQELRSRDLQVLADLANDRFPHFIVARHRTRAAIGRIPEN